MRNPFCLKTGGIVILEEECIAFEGDLHCLDKILIARVTLRALDPSMSKENRERVTVTIHGHEYFFIDRNNTGYGTIIVPQRHCLLSLPVVEMIYQYYPEEMLEMDFENRLLKKVNHG